MLFVSEVFDPKKKNSGKISDLVSYFVQMVWFNDCVFEACKEVDVSFKLQNGMIDVWKLDQFFCPKVWIRMEVPTKKHG